MKFKLERSSQRWCDENVQECFGDKYEKPHAKATFNKVKNYYEIEINTLEELVKLAENEKTDIIVKVFAGDDKNETHLEFYDDYRE